MTTNDNFIGAMAYAINERGNKKYNIYQLGKFESLDLANAAYEAIIKAGYKLVKKDE